MKQKTSHFYSAQALLEYTIIFAIVLLALVGSNFLGNTLRAFNSVYHSAVKEVLR